jgi:perosamine synthetase
VVDQSLKFSRRVPKEPLFRWDDFPLVCPAQSVPRPLKDCNIYYFQQARYALFHGLRLLGIRPGEEVLVPAFHCSTLIESVLRTGVEIKFYNVKPTLLIDLEDLRQRVGGRTTAVVIVHFFGVVQPMERIRGLCAEYGLYLVEDCAHVLRGHCGTQELGSYGDISVFSWRKFFPITNGGALAMPRNLPGKTPEQNKCSLFQEFHEFIWGVRQCLHPWASWMRGRMSEKVQTDIQWEFIEGLRRSNPDEDFCPKIALMKESRFSLNYLRKCQLEQICHLRNRNWQFLTAAFAEVDLFPTSWGEVWRQAVAWAFPILIPGYDNFHIELRKRGIPAFTWGGVIHHTLDLRAFPDAELLYSHLVMLPIHQDLTLEELHYMVESIYSILDRRGVRKGRR